MVRCTRSSSVCQGSSGRQYGGRSGQSRCHRWLRLLPRIAGHEKLQPNYASLESRLLTASSSSSSLSLSSSSSWFSSSSFSSSSSPSFFLSGHHSCFRLCPGRSRRAPLASLVDAFVDAFICFRTFLFLVPSSLSLPVSSSSVFAAVASNVRIHVHLVCLEVLGPRHRCLRCYRTLVCDAHGRRQCRAGGRQ